MIRRGVLQNARFAASVIVTGVKHSPKEDKRLSIRSDAIFPTLYQIRRQGKFNTPVAFATAHAASLFIKFFPREIEGVFPPEALPVEVRRAILAGVKKSGVRVAHKITVLKPAEDQEDM